jgi:hypothetical protein
MERPVVPSWGLPAAEVGQWRSDSFFGLRWKVDLRAPTGPFITAVAKRTKSVCAGAFILSHYFYHVEMWRSLYSIACGSMSSTISTS